VGSGATKNFINLLYAKWLQLSIKRLEKPPPLYNVDSTKNKSGNLQFYINLKIQTGSQGRNHCFFLSDLEEHKAILRYP
jgi:hypothetical protein